MDTVFVRAVFDIDCDWEGLPPVYRVFVNDELFTERTWIWSDQHLQETLQIQAAPGKYLAWLSSVPGTTGSNTDQDAGSKAL